MITMITTSLLWVMYDDVVIDARDAALLEQSLRGGVALFGVLPKVLQFLSTPKSTPIEKFQSLRYFRIPIIFLYLNWNFRIQSNFLIPTRVSEKTTTIDDDPYCLILSP
jgi:hypothetical protein